MKPPIRVAVTGGAGQIGYSLLYRLVNGEAFGPDQPVILQMLEVPQGMDGLRGAVLELEDCAYPLLAGVTMTDDPNMAFKDANWAILVGGKPRGKGMERADVIRDNAPIFVAQGRAINEKAASNVRVLVVANPCNTNALIALKSAPDVPIDRWMAMTRLDENRSRFQLAQKAKVGVEAVTNLGIWGNHSPTMFPDFEHVKIGGKPALDAIPDRAWFETDFLKTIQQRGKTVIDLRGKSSAASAANAIVNHLQTVLKPTAPGDWFSAGLLSEGNPYDIPGGLVYSFPVRSSGDGCCHWVGGLDLSDYARGRLQITTAELLEEREAVADLLK